MNLEQAIQAYLSADATLLARAAAGVRQDRLPPQERRCGVTISTVHEGRLIHQEGTGLLADALLQLDCWSESKWTATAARDRVEQLLEAASGEIAEGVTVRRCFVEGLRITYHEPDDDGETGMYQASIDVRIWFERAETETS